MPVGRQCAAEYRDGRLGFADYKDTVFNPNSAANLQISDCGAVQVIKDTEPEGGTGAFDYTLSRSGGDRSGSRTTAGKRHYRAR